jgi:hypothetical protein
MVGESKSTGESRGFHANARAQAEFTGQDGIVTGP